ncbi:MAG: thioredoxin domain-containing protein [Puniceicoccaceae bacterium]
MSNRLASESSLYLRQHAGNPVDWWPWCDEAFARATAGDKPVLVSIGYSSCHWCHVMAHESFENDFIARLMNKHFICIKVDREERPDVDRVYMEAVQMINQHGGWPLNVFCLPDGRPFYGGTYFPPEDRGQGLIPWPQLLMRISEYFETRRSELEENAGNIVANLEHLSVSAQEGGAEWSPRDLLDAARRICASIDTANGGLGGAPKFPPTMVLQFLLAVRQTRACGNEFPALADEVDRGVRLTLDRMARGGLFDQVGGGFCRYCVDAAWTIPHFEKMLYDNALLVETFAEGWARYRDPLHERVVAETIDWLEREMRLPSGLYAASIDADSPEGEGRFYCWTPASLEEALGAETAARFAAAYRITPGGNFEDGLSYPQLDGTLADRDALAEARTRLREVRSARPAPARDDKELTFWNALAARALLRAGSVFGRPEWIGRGAEIVDVLLEKHFAGGRLAARSGDGAVEGFLDDYATLAHAALVASGRGDVLPAARCRSYLGKARELADAVRARFANADGSAYFFTSEDSGPRVLRQVEWYDNATPAGNSTLVHLFSGLAALVDDSDHRRARDSLRPSYAPLIERAPNGVAHALAGWTHEASGLVVARASSAEDLRLLAEALRGRCWRPHWLRTDEGIPPGTWRICVGPGCLPDFTSARDAAEAAAPEVRADPAAGAE